MKKPLPKPIDSSQRSLKALLIDLGRGREEGEVLALIEARVRELLDTNRALLFSHLYRMDIDEGVVRALLDRPPANQTVARALAVLIWDRQKQRMHTRRRIEVGDDEIPPEMRW